MLELNEIHNPFPGLRPFEMDETNLFFGRDGQSDELLKRMQRTRLLAVVGTSGSGKSSLIRAGRQYRTAVISHVGIASGVVRRLDG